MSRRRRRFQWLRLLLVFAAVTGCARGADEERLRADVQSTLDRDVQPGLFKIVGLRREGSAPLPKGESGAERVVVYFNTTLELAKDYRSGEWDQLSPSSIAYALGATEKGVFGLKAQNQAGDRVRAYGSTVYEQTRGGWTPVVAAPVQTAAAPDFDGTAPPSRSRQLIDRLAAMVNLPPPGVAPQDDEIIAEELSRASENIQRRVERREHIFTIATGPVDGEYAKVGAAVIDAVKRLAPGVRLRQRNTEGSIENVRLLAAGEADYGIVQSDVAAAALDAQDVFARTTPVSNLRAVGGLFPEPIHVVVLEDSPIYTVTDLRGRRVNIGTPASGTRYDAVAVLSAAGIRVEDLREAREGTLPSAIAQLQRGNLDALFLTASAPARPLQRLASQTKFRLLPIAGAVMDRLALARPGVVGLTLAPNTYPGLKEPVRTAGSAALLVTTTDAPDIEVERLADLVFTRMPQQGAGTEGLRILPDHELRGVTIPLHPGAARRPVSTTGTDR
jgi:TRAP transporter TAXI family solute receptor